MNRFHLNLLLWAFALNPVFAHDHFEAAVVDKNLNNQSDAGEPLKVLGPDLSGKTFHLLARPAGFRPLQRCGGYYMLGEAARTLFPLDAFSFTVLSDGQTMNPPEPEHPHTGAWIWVEIVSVAGPEGANFGFWERGRSAAADTPSQSFQANQPTGNYAFIVSGGHDSASEDPWGHVHGRDWTADKAGDYHVSFRFVDRSTTGPGGGPWHLPSELFTFHFKAGPDFQPRIARSPTGHTVLTWQSQMGIWDDASTPQTGVEFEILRNTDLKGEWKRIGSVTGTTAATASFTDVNPPAGKAFYRLAYKWGGRVN